MKVYDTLRPYADRLDNVVLTCNGVPLKPIDARVFRMSMLLRVALLWDLPFPTADCLNAAYRALVSVKEIDVAVYGESLKTVNVALRKVISSESRQGARDFACSLGIAYRGLIFGGFYQIVDWYLRNPVKFGFLCLSCFDFQSKLTLRKVDFETKMIQDYLETEARISEWNYSRELLSELNSIAIELLSDFPRYEACRIKHGPGSTLEFRAEAHSRAVKGFSAVVDSETFEVLTDFGVDPEDLEIAQQATHSCEIVFVPKSMTSKRVISMEETSMQSVQQAVKDRIYSYCGSSDWWRMVLTFEDQSPSRVLAQRGSIDGSFATLDLSAASDSVSAALVDAVFRSTPLHRALLVTRSEYAIVDEKRLLMRKFAPMGSATCFAVESLVFCFICELARRRRRSRRLFRVFGDDLVIPKEYAGDVQEILAQLGFKVNDRKSYVGTGPHIFREACGIEAIDGFDITPLRLSRQFRWNADYASRGEISPSEFAAAVGLANRCFEVHIRGPRSFILRALALRMDISLVARGSNATIRDNSSNLDRLPYRYSEDLQRLIYFSYQLKADRDAAGAFAHKLCLTSERLYQLWLFEHRLPEESRWLPPAAEDWFLKSGNHCLQLRPPRRSLTQIIPVGQTLEMSAYQDNSLDR